MSELQSILRRVYDESAGALRISGSAGGSGAPTDAHYITTQAESGLSAEVVFGTTVVTTGALASRPAANAVPAGALYFATEGLGYISDGSSTWTSISSKETAALLAANNLTDVANTGTARSNLGLGTAATVNTGTSSGTIPLLGTGGVLAMGRLATGTPDGTKFVRDDGTLVTPTSGATDLDVGAVWLHGG